MLITSEGIVVFNPMTVPASVLSDVSRALVTGEAMGFLLTKEGAEIMVTHQGLDALTTISGLGISADGLKKTFASGDPSQISNQLFSIGFGLPAGALFASVGGGTVGGFCMGELTSSLMNKFLNDLSNWSKSVYLPDEVEYLWDYFWDWLFDPDNQNPFNPFDPSLYPEGEVPDWVMEGYKEWQEKQRQQGIDPNSNDSFNDAKKFIVHRDPLVLDLDGDGIETVGTGSTPVLFDHDGDGTKTGTGWVKGDDAFVVLDRNGNGVIDNGSELFGVDTILKNGHRKPQTALKP